MDRRLSENRCLSCYNDFCSRRALIHHLLMVHGQQLPYASRRLVDLNPTDLRRRLEQVRDEQRRARFTLQQETRQAPQAAEGRPRDWDSENQGGADERMRGLRARMGPSPPSEEATGRWDPMPSLGTRRAQARTVVDRDTIRPIPQGMDRSQDFSGNEKSINQSINHLFQTKPLQFQWNE